MNWRIYKKISLTVLVTSIAFIALLFLVFGIPVIGFLVVTKFLNALGCEVTQLTVQVCYAWEYDLSWRFNQYFKMPTLALIFTPFAFFLAFYDVIFYLWLVGLVFGGSYLYTKNKVLGDS